MLKLGLLLFIYCMHHCQAQDIETTWLGCFEDKPERALPVPLKTRKSLKKRCARQTILKGYTVFGIQNQAECWSGPDAEETYDRYGPSRDCVNGIGGSWANSVYRVKSDTGLLTKLIGELVENATSIEDVDVGLFVESSSNLLKRPSTEWKKDPKIADKFLSSTENLLGLGMTATSPVEASTDQMVFSVSNVDTVDVTSLTFPDYKNPLFDGDKRPGSFNIPVTNTSNKANVGGFVYDNLEEKLVTTLDDTDEMYTADSRQDIASKVLACEVNPPVMFGINTKERISITLEHITAPKDGAIPVCAFWKHPKTDKLSGKWSTKGCYVVSSNKTHTQCNCTHLTNFAILMQYKEVKVADHHERALKILTIIGCSLSLAGLFVTITIYLVFGIFRNTNFHIHLNLCLAIALTQIFLLTASKASEDKTSCIVVSAFFHYFCLSIFTWMLVEGLQIYRKVVSIFSSSVNLMYCHILGWGVPIIIVVVSYVIRKDNYTDLETCWLSTDYGIRWSFIGPVLGIIAVNIFVTAVTLFKRLKLRSIATKEMSFKLKTSLRALFVLLPIFGITWLVGIFGFTAQAVPAMYIFVILNSSQGVLMFIFHCAFNAEVRKVVLQGRRAHARNATLCTQINKISSKNDADQSNDTSRQSSKRSLKETEDTNGNDLHLAENVIPTTSTKYLAP